MLGKVAVATAALVVVCAASVHWLLADWAGQPFWTKLVTLFGTVIVAMAAFAGCGMALRIDELQQIAAGVGRRLRRA
jgi:peptidoglycan biosynthesis protein MviN/MurJ (putative lipid II flippase)